MNFENGFGKNETPVVKGLEEQDANKGAETPDTKKFQKLYESEYENARKNRELADQAPINGAPQQKPEFSIAPAPDANGMRIEEGFDSSVSAVIETWNTDEWSSLTREDRSKLMGEVTNLQLNLTSELTAVDAREMTPDAYAEKLISIQEKYLVELQKVSDTAHGLIHGTAAKKDAEGKEVEGEKKKLLDVRKAFDEHMAELIKQRDAEMLAKQRDIAKQAQAAAKQQEHAAALDGMRTALQNPGWPGGEVR